MRAAMACWRPNVSAGLLLCCSWMWACNEQVATPDIPVKLSERRSVKSSVWPSQDFNFTWLTWQEGLDVANEEGKPLLYYIAAPGCDGLFKNPSLLVRALIEKSFVSVRIHPFVHPDWVARLSVAGCPALINALPDGRVFARAVDIPPNNVEQYLLRMHSVFKKERKRLLTKVNQEAKVVFTKYSTTELQQYLMASFDWKQKGLFGPQKFLHATALRFLWQTGNPDAIAFVEETVEVLIASPLWEDGSFRLFSYSPDWNHPAPERDLLDQAEIIGLLIEMERWELIEKWVSYINKSIADSTTGALYGRQLLRVDGEWWTDPNVYVDRMASLLVRLIEIFERRNSALAYKLASEGIEYILNECVDGSGGVRHVCNGDGASRLPTDQALVALALSAWSSQSDNSSLGQLANQVIQTGIEKSQMDLDELGLVFAAFWYWNYGEKSRAEQMISAARYDPEQIRQAALWGLLDLRLDQLKR